MLARIDRVRGYRSREVLNQNKFKDVAKLLDTVRSRRLPSWNDEATRLRRRHAEASREEALKLEAWRTLQADKGARPSERRESLAAYERAQATRKDAGAAMGRAKEIWDQERAGLTKQVLYDVQPELQKAFDYIVGAIETEEAARLLDALADDLELRRPSPPEQEPDLRVVLAMIVTLGQALDSYWEQTREVGLKLSRIRTAPPSATLGRIIGGIA